MIQTMSAKPTELAFSSTPLGLTKIPEPMMLPVTHRALNGMVIMRKKGSYKVIVSLNWTTSNCLVSDLLHYYTYKCFVAQKMENNRFSILQRANHWSWLWMFLCNALQAWALYSWQESISASDKRVTRSSQRSQCDNASSANLTNPYWRDWRSWNKDIAR